MGACGYREFNAGLVKEAHHMKKGCFDKRLSGCPEYGGVVVRALIVVVTLCIVGGAIYYLLLSFGRDQEAYHRKALAISEYGLQVVLQQLQSGASVSEVVPKTEYDKGWYRVTFDKYLRSDTMFLDVRAEGHAGSESEKRECILFREIRGGDTMWVPVSIR